MKCFFEAPIAIDGLRVRIRPISANQREHVWQCRRCDPCLHGVSDGHLAIRAWVFREQVMSVVHLASEMGEEWRGRWASRRIHKNFGWTPQMPDDHEIIPEEEGLMLPLLNAPLTPHIEGLLTVNPGVKAGEFRRIGRFSTRNDRNGESRDYFENLLQRRDREMAESNCEEVLGEEGYRETPFAITSF